MFTAEAFLSSTLVGWYEALSENVLNNQL